MSSSSLQSPCVVHLREVESACWSQTVFTRYGGCDDVACSFEEKASSEIRSGAGGSRLDVLNDRWRISGRRTDDGYGSGADRRTRSSGYPRCRRNRRCQPGDILCLRQREHSVRQGRRSVGLARLRWLPRLSWLPRLRRLQGLPRLWLRRRLLRFLGSLPLVLSGLLSV